MIKARGIAATKPYEINKEMLVSHLKYKLGNVHLLRKARGGGGEGHKMLMQMQEIKRTMVLRSLTGGGGVKKVLKSALPNK